jgi:hypothetical protein
MGGTNGLEERMPSDRICVGFWASAGSSTAANTLLGSPNAIEGHLMSKYKDQAGLGIWPLRIVQKPLSLNCSSVQVAPCTTAAEAKEWLRNYCQGSI